MGISDLRSRLQAGEAVAAFDFRRDQLKIKWLKQFLNAGFSVSEGNSPRWLVSLVYPTGIMALVEVVDGWDVTTHGGGLCLRPDPRVPKPTTTPVPDMPGRFRATERDADAVEGLAMPAGVCRVQVERSRRISWVAVWPWT